MPLNLINPNDSLIPPQPIPDGAQDLSKRVRGLLDGQPKDKATVEKAFEGMDEVFDLIAAGLYSLASMLAGEGEDSIRLVETAVATAEVSACHDPEQARKSSHRTLANLALALLEQRNPGCLAAPEGFGPTGPCIEGDDLAAAGVSSEELENMIAGPDRDRVRNWLASLPTVLRTVFVLRAVAAFTTADTAAVLMAHGGPKAAAWTPSAVSEIFRQGLCSLASQLIHSTATR
jgi:DNA-directed RNA polymerase specialized sigma24 family protein